MGLFSNSSLLVKKLKARTRQLDVIQKLQRVRDGSKNTQEFLDRSVKFVGEELLSRCVSIVLSEEDKHIVAASTMPEVVEQHEKLMVDMARGAITTNSTIVLNTTRKHLRLRAAGILCALVVPMRRKGQAVGAILVWRMRRFKFGPRSIHTLTTISEHLPVHAEYMAAGESSDQKSKELKVIYEVDQIREQCRDTKALCDALANLIKEQTSAKGAFVLHVGKETTYGGIGTAAANRAVLERFGKSTISEGEQVEEELGAPLNASICVPITVGDEHAAFGMVNPESDTFTDEDKRILSAIAHQADKALFEDREKKKIKDLFGKYVSSEVLEALSNNPEAMKVERREVTMLFADLRGFTALTEKVAPEQVVELLNEYYNKMTDIIVHNKGTLDKFVGDAVVAFFGAPVFFEDHAKRAVKAALEMQFAFRKLHAAWERKGYPKVGLGCGLDSGSSVVGTVGGERRWQYTAVGDHVNTASRLCSSASDGQTLISQNVYDQVRKSINVNELAPLSLKGKSASVKVYNATSFR